MMLMCQAQILATSSASVQWSPTQSQFEFIDKTAILSLLFQDPGSSLHFHHSEIMATTEWHLQQFLLLVYIALSDASLAFQVQGPS